MSSEWTYVAEYSSMKNTPRTLRGLYRSRPRSNGVPEDQIFTKGDWRPTGNLIGIRMGYGDHDAVDISEDEAERLTDGFRRSRIEALRAGVADMVEILRGQGLSERAAEIEALHASMAGGPHIEERLHELASTTGVPDGIVDEDTIIRYNRAQRAVVHSTRATQH